MDRFGKEKQPRSQTFSLLSASGLRPSLESNSGGVRLSVEARVKEPRISPNGQSPFEAARKPLACTPPLIFANRIFLALGCSAPADACKPKACVPPQAGKARLGLFAVLFLIHSHSAISFPNLINHTPRNSYLREVDRRISTKITEVRVRCTLSSCTALVQTQKEKHRESESRQYRVTPIYRKLVTLSLKIIWADFRKISSRIDR